MMQSVSHSEDGGSTGLSPEKELDTMTEVRKVAVLVGSLRKESFSRKIANALTKLAPPSLKLEIVEIGQLSFYNQDSEEGGNQPPESWVAFRKRVKEFDAVLFVTPEYNRSVPGVLKNAIDVGSRPYGQSAWSGKPGAVVSVSPGAIGGFGANHHLRQSLVFLDVPVLQQPEAYVGGVADLLDASGNLTKEESKAFALKFLQAFAAWIEANRKG
jgi:chromate reductase